MKTVLIIPARDEAATIADVIRSVRAVFDGEIIVVDNGSSDATGEQATMAGARAVFEARPGYGQACMAGVAAASTDTGVFVFMDGDGSDRPEDIASVTGAIAAGADVALGVRTGSNVEAGLVAPAARFGNWLSGSLIGLAWGERLHDLSPLKAIRADALRRIEPRERTYGWTVELLASAIAMRMHVVEVPVGYRCRAGGESKVSGRFGPSLRAGSRILTTLARVWLRRPDFVRAGIGTGLLAAVAFITAFMLWLANAGPSSFGVYAAALLIAWPAVLVGVLGGAAGGAGLVAMRRRSAIRQRSIGPTSPDVL